jgi:transcriptional regulator with PAS, ATPase and Fis domain
LKSSFKGRADQLSIKKRSKALSVHEEMRQPFFPLRTTIRQESTIMAQPNSLQCINDRKNDSKQNVSLNHIIGDAPSMKDVLSTVKKVASSKFSSVLIQGESGTGKNLIAEAIHNLSACDGEAFMDINCSAFPESLLESEMFGQERGAFTSAYRLKKGFFELADRGTLYLDEIADMPLALQAKLLKATETKCFRRVGGTKEITVAVRIIAATNKDLMAEVEARRFRRDLYYRLQVIPIHLPPLRERREDIPVLMQFFIDMFNKEFEKNVKEVSDEALECLARHSWPGNVRELKNTIERILILEENERIEVENLPPEIAGFEHCGIPVTLFNEFDFNGLSLDEIEKGLLHRSLSLAKGNQSRAAELLGISRDTFRYRIKKFGLQPRNGHAHMSVLK